MKIVLFGATGMIGQGVLRECLADPSVERVVTIGRSVTGRQHPKLREISHENFADFSALAGDLSGYDACFYCLGVTSAGMSEPDYRRVTYDMTLAAARALVSGNPSMTFIFVSGAGADSSERGRLMWARVKGAAENALMRMPFKAVFVFRPAFVQPLHGITSRTRIYRVFYAIVGPFYPLLERLLPTYVTTTETIGRAMIALAAHGSPARVLENADINAVAEGRARQ
jgi:uncharacterized protein YbjT (DUF2867 family)